MNAMVKEYQWQGDGYLDLKKLKKKAGPSVTAFFFSIHTQELLRSGLL